jgi:hypothetical protein
MEGSGRNCANPRALVAAHRDVFRAAQSHDAVLGLLALMDKAGVATGSLT